MKFSSRLFLFSVTALLFTIYMVSCNLRKTTAVVLDVAAKPFENLSEYNFFTGVLNDLKPNTRVLPYDLTTPLFTDYAHKARFVYMPDSMRVNYDTSKSLEFPVGTCLIKNFYYPEDFRQPNGKKKIIETRLLVHRVAGWEALTYIWNDEQTDGILENTGGIQHISWTHYDGTKRETDYIIPNKNQCKSCHWRNDVQILPIGPKVRNLNRDYDYENGAENQLVHWAKAGFLKNLPEGNLVPKIPDFADSVHYNTNERARAYLEMNCGHCHSPYGPAYTSGLHLNWENMNAENLGFCKAPVAAGKATGNHLYDIVPGIPAESILLFRMLSNDPEIKMPEVGRTLVHTEGVELIEKWISEMKPEDCKAGN